MRETRRWGTQRIANYLLRKRIKLSGMTVWRVLKSIRSKLLWNVARNLFLLPADFFHRQHPDNHIPPPLFIAAGKTCLTAIRDARLVPACRHRSLCLKVKQYYGSTQTNRVHIAACPGGIPAVRTTRQGGRQWSLPFVTRNFAASLFRNIKYFTLRKLYLCRKWMQKRLQKTTTTGITLPNFDFLAWAVLK